MLCKVYKNDDVIYKQTPSRHFQHEKGPMAFSGHCKFREGSFTALELSVCSVYDE